MILDDIPNYNYCIFLYFRGACNCFVTDVTACIHL